MKKLLLPFCFLAILLTAKSQSPNNNSSPIHRQNINAGHFYGKVVDANGKALAGASVQLMVNKVDTASNTRKDIAIKTQMTAGNGDFSLEDLPVMGSYKLKISYAGFKPLVQSVAFDFKRNASGVTADDADKAASLLSMVDKDLGNIKLLPDAKELKEVTIVAAKPLFQMGVDRKIFNVENNLTTVGQTATEVMKSIPGVNVDIDGNVTLRNAAPTIYMDGRPTTLTLDQIPADAIASVELITNPSAKFEAATGNAGILNIVLKKNNKVGYNGSVRAGVDSRGKMNTGVDLNIREKKINVFASAMYNQRKSIATSSLVRNDLTTPGNQITQDGNNTTVGHFDFIRFGADYFIDNRNTLTFTQTIGGGSMNGNNTIGIDSLANSNVYAYGNSLTNSLSKSNNYVSSLDYKHTYATKGKEWSSFVTYNTNKISSNSDLNTQFYLPDNIPDGKSQLQQTIANGTNKYFTAQTDFTDPLSKNSKLEMGARAAIRDFTSVNNNYFYDAGSNGFVISPLASSQYAFKDAVYAGYVTFSSKVGEKFLYQVGLRGESSNYNGSLTDKDVSFSTKYPISLFPSAFLTYKITDKQDLQLNYSRRINRPGFFQLLPYVDYSNPQNLIVGNPALQPSFTNAYELNYSKIFDNKNSLLASAYFKNSTNLITGYQYKAVDPVTAANTVYSSYTNANSSMAYGVELTAKNAITSWWDLMTSMNLYNAKLNGSNIQAALSTEQVSWFGKLNNNIKLPRNFTIQLSGDYESKSVLPQGTGSSVGKSGYGGAGGYGSATTLSAQGYVNPSYGVDAAIKKTFLKNNAAAITLSMADIFRTRLYSYYSETPFFDQTYNRRRDPQIVHLNFSFRFGKMDASLFKRKNNKNTDNTISQDL